MASSPENTARDRVLGLDDEQIAIRDKGLVLILNEHHDAIDAAVAAAYGWPVDLADDDRAMLYGAFLWMADKLRSNQGDHAAALWRRRGKRAFNMAQAENGDLDSPAPD